MKTLLLSLLMASWTCCAVDHSKMIVQQASAGISVPVHDINPPRAALSAAVAPLPTQPTNVLLSWDNDPRAMLYTEIWDDPNQFTLFGYYHIRACTTNNYISIPATNFFTNYAQLYDTNGNFTGWETDAVNSDMFISVGCGYWNYRHTNYTRVQLQ